MKTIMALAGTLISFNLMAADIYEFNHEPAVQPAPAKVAPKPAPKPAPNVTRTTPAQAPASPASQPAVTGTTPNAVVQTPHCAAGATCNDL